MDSNDYIYGHLAKIEWLVADATAVGSLDRTEHAILGVILAERGFRQSRTYVWSGEPLYGVGTPS